MKKLISLLLAVLMVCSTGISAFAINAIPSASATEIEAGETVAIDVTVDEAYSNLTGLEARLYFDTELFTWAVTSKKSGVTVNKDVKTDSIGNYLQIGLISLDPDGVSVDVGESLANITFTAKEDISAKTEAKFVARIAKGGLATGEKIPESEIKEITVTISPASCDHIGTETETAYTAKGDGNHTVTVTCKKCGEVISTTEEACAGDEEHTTYAPKNDGTHDKTVKCAKCDYTISFANEPCTKGEDGKCAACGYIFPSSGDDEYTITVNVAPSTVNVTFYGDENGETALAANKVVDKGVVDKYHVYEITVPEGMYSYRAVDTADNHDLGGMTFEAPVSVEIGADGKPIHGEQKMTLVRVNYYTTNTKVSAVGDYSIDIMPGKMKNVVTGAQYIDSRAKVVTPTLLYAHGNALLYNWKVTLNEELSKTYGVALSINNTFGEGLSTTQNKTFTLSNLNDYSVTAPKGVTVRFFNQIKNFNVEELEVASVNENGDGTVTYGLRAPGGNLTYRVSMEGKVTKAGYFDTNKNKNITVTFDENENPKSTVNEVSSSVLAKRMESSTMVNVNGQNNLSLVVGETFRLRAYRGAWQIINSDTANIMIEPDFNYTVISGGDHIKMTPAVNRCTGNAGVGEQTNWMDIEGVSEGIAIIEVSYDAIEIGGNTNYSGTYGATDPKRTSLIVISIGGDNSGLSMNAVGAENIWDTEYDTVYTLTNAATFSFNATLDGAEPTVQFSTDKGKTWKGVGKNADGSFTAAGLVEGNNIIKFVANGKTAYQVVRAAKVTYTITNATRGGNVAYAGDDITLVFNGLYQPIAKFSGIYNPGFGQGHKVSYNLLDNAEFKSAGGGQYDFISTNKYTFTAKSAGNVVLSGGNVKFNVMGTDTPLGGHRILTDSGVGANFSAVSTQHVRDILPEVTINVKSLVDITVNFVCTPANAVVTLYDATGAVVAANEDGSYTGRTGDYTYNVTADGYITTHGRFTLTEADSEGKTVTVNLEKGDATIWDGKTLTEITPNADGVYEVRTGAELAWIASQVNSGNTAITKVKLMNDISLGNNAWTPIGDNYKEFSGEFDGNGHIISDLYINNKNGRQALFGTVRKATITKLGVKGSVTTNQQYAAGIVAYAYEGTVISQCFSAVEVIGSSRVAGILANPQLETITITDCYNVGNITATSSNGIASGICGSCSQQGKAPQMTNCYNVGKVTGASRSGSISDTTKEAAVVNSYYLKGSHSLKVNTGYGIEKLESEMKAAEMVTLLGASFRMDKENINSGYPILVWQAHEWGETTYTWSSDNKTVTAAHSCLQHPEETETETVNTVYSVVKAATCEAKGEGKYVATFTNAAFEKQEKTVEIPATDHDWAEPTYEWSSDNKTCTAKRVCKNDQSHIESETVNSVYSVIKAATCEAKGEGKYVAAFTNAAFEEQKKTVEIPANDHDWAEPTYEWSSDNKTCTAKRICKTDQSHIESETVNSVYSVIKAAACEAKGEGKYVATFTNAAFEKQEKTVEIPATDHDWAEPTYEWGSDNKTCTAKRVCKNDKAHEQTQSVNTVSKTLKEATCTEKGSVEYTADFGSNNYGFVKQSKTVETTALGHKLEHHDAKAATCVAEGNVEYWECSVCNKFFSDKEGKNELTTVVTDKNPKNHVGETEVKDYKEATCSESGYTGDTYCKSCGKLIAEGKVSPVVPHKFGEWKVTKQPTKNSAGEKVRYCEVCQYEQKIEIPRLSDGDVIHIGIGDSKGEQNPETGAQVPGGIAAIAVAAAAAVIFGKKKRG